MNTKTKQVEMRTSKYTVDPGSALQKGADFLKAFTLGFDVDVPIRHPRRVGGADENRTQFPSYDSMIYTLRHSQFKTSNPPSTASILVVPSVGWQDTMAGQNSRLKIVRGRGLSLRIIKSISWGDMRISRLREIVFVGLFWARRRARSRGN